MSNTSTSESTTLVCANCGKEGSDVNNECNKCHRVKYCNAACKKKHRHKHKNECEMRVAEFHDEKLFKQPPPLEDCPICFLRMPLLGTGKMYMSCCGKVICYGCIYAVQSRATKKEEDICPFCRTPPKSDEEIIKRLEKHMELNDANAIFNLGCFYAHGQRGLPQNYAKALEFYHRAAELGFTNAYYGIGVAYLNGETVERDTKKAIHYFELAAMGGDDTARYRLGVVEGKVGNYDRSMKHWMIAARDGNVNSLKNIRQLYTNGYATKDEYAKALRSYQAYIDEIKSNQRDEAAAADDGKYYGSVF